MSDYDFRAELDIEAEIAAREHVAARLRDLTAGSRGEHRAIRTQSRARCSVCGADRPRDLLMPPAGAAGSRPVRCKPCHVAWLTPCKTPCNTLPEEAELDRTPLTWTDAVKRLAQSDRYYTLSDRAHLLVGEARQRDYRRWFAGEEPVHVPYLSWAQAIARLAKSDAQEPGPPNDGRLALEEHRRHYLHHYHGRPGPTPGAPIPDTTPDTSVPAPA